MHSMNSTSWAQPIDRETGIDLDVNITYCILYEIGSGVNSALPLTLSPRTIQYAS
jgi:hypothetical protein